eukprot:gene9664-10652_t
MARPRKSSYAKGKPALSYISLCTMAIQSSPNKMMKLKEICEYVAKNFAFYQHSDTRWKDSLRHNLSFNDCFVKVLDGEIDENKKSHYWRLHPECGAMFHDGSMLRRRKRFHVKSANDAKQLEGTAKKQKQLQTTEPARNKYKQWEEQTLQEFVDTRNELKVPKHQFLFDKVVNRRECFQYERQDKNHSNNWVSTYEYYQKESKQDEEVNNIINNPAIIAKESKGGQLRQLAENGARHLSRNSWNFCIENLLRNTVINRHNSQRKEMMNHVQENRHPPHKKRLVTSAFAHYDYQKDFCALFGHRNSQEILD